MRLRHIPGSEQEISESPYVIQQHQVSRGQIHQFFANNNPIEIEVGMGKGRFIMEKAIQNPSVNYIGIERYPSVMLRALQKRAELDVNNIYLMCIDAKLLTEVFAPEEISRIYLNFSDPWPKDRHAKRRLTSPEFLKVYDQILQKDGFIEFKTDNIGLFEYSLESIPAAGWKIVDSTFDLHHNKMAEGNVMTEYEMKFSAKGNPICKLIACR